jgi:uncharacterized protein (TIGR00297 family)
MLILSMTEILAESGRVFVALVGLLALVGVGEGLRRLGVRATTSRRVVHAGVGLFVVITPFLFATAGPVYVLAGVFVAANAVARWRQWWPGVHAARPHSLGTVAFPLALFPALLLGWRNGAEHLLAFQAAFLVLAFSDPLAAWVGERQPRPTVLGASSKSWQGSVAFAVSAWGLCAVTLTAGVQYGRLAATGYEIAGISLVVAIVTTMTEWLGRRGWDNFFIVPAAMIPLIVWEQSPHRLGMLLAGGGAGLLFAALAWRLRALSPSGTVAGGLLAAALIGLGGVSWAVPAFVFFILSSLLSRVGKRRKRHAASRSAKGTVRDAGQVYANGAVGGTLLVLHAVAPSPLLYWGFLGAFAAAAADTWATEVGTLSSRPPRHITTGAIVPQGSSGAVSGVGTSAALVGAASVGGSAWAVAPGSFGLLGGGWGLGLVVAAGMAGALADSIAGATIQAQYETADGGTTERPAGALQRGWKWVTNDRVNWICTGVGALVACGGAALMTG